MENYRSTSGKQSGVTAYEIGTDFIKVQFIKGSIYEYTYSRDGKNNVEIMKAKARAQNGLATFISQNRIKGRLIS